MELTRNIHVVITSFMLLAILQLQVTTDLSSEVRTKGETESNEVNLLSEFIESFLTSFTSFRLLAIFRL